MLSKKVHIMLGMNKLPSAKRAQAARFLSDEGGGLACASEFKLRYYVMTNPCVGAKVVLAVQFQLKPIAY